MLFIKKFYQCVDFYIVLQFMFICKESVGLAAFPLFTPFTYLFNHNLRFHKPCNKMHVARVENSNYWTLGKRINNQYTSHLVHKVVIFESLWPWSEERPNITKNDAK